MLDIGEISMQVTLQSTVPAMNTVMVISFGDRRTDRQTGRQRQKLKDRQTDRLTRGERERGGVLGDECWTLMR